MMIQKKTNDTMRKTVLRSPMIMMTHPPLLSGEAMNPEHRIGANRDAGGRHEDFDRPVEHDGVILPTLRSLRRCRLVMNL